MSDELKPEGSLRFGPSETSHAIRTVMSMRMDVLRTVANGIDRPTQIMVKANMSWRVLQSYLKELVSSGLLVEEDLGSRKRYALTGKGAELVAEPERKQGSIEDRLDNLEETIEVLSDRSALRGIKEGLADLKAGRYKRYDSAYDYKKSLK